MYLVTRRNKVLDPDVPVEENTALNAYTIIPDIIASADFFISRNIDPSWVCDTHPAFQEIMDSFVNNQPVSQEMDESIKTIIRILGKSSFLYQEDWSPIISDILKLSVTNCDRFQVYHKVEIGQRAGHRLYSDFTIYSQFFSDYLFFVIQDFNEDLNQARFATFDILREYSRNWPKVKLKYIFGIATTTNKLQFTCYVRPASSSTAELETDSNFITGPLYTISHGTNTPFNDKYDSIKTIMLAVSGFMRDDIENIFSEQLTKLSNMKIRGSLGEYGKWR